jgi:hypothetical protein
MQKLDLPRAFDANVLALQLRFQRSSALHRVQRDIDAAPLERRQNPRKMPLGAADIETRCDDCDARRKHAKINQDSRPR